MTTTQRAALAATGALEKEKGAMSSAEFFAAYVRVARAIKEESP